MYGLVISSVLITGLMALNFTASLVDQFTFLILLLRMGIMASVAGVLITSSFFKRLIFLDRRTTTQNWWLALILGVMLMIGGAVRVLVGYEGVDFSLPGVFLDPARDLAVIPSP